MSRVDPKDTEALEKWLDEFPIGKKKIGENGVVLERAISLSDISILPGSMSIGRDVQGALGLIVVPWVYNIGLNFSITYDTVKKTKKGETS